MLVKSVTSASVNLLLDKCWGVGMSHLLLHPSGDENCDLPQLIAQIYYLYCHNHSVGVGASKPWASHFCVASLSSDGWSGQVFLASGAIVFTSFGRNLKKKKDARVVALRYALALFAAWCTGDDTSVHRCTYKSTAWSVCFGAHSLMFQQHAVLYLPSQSTFFFSLQIVSFLFPRKSDMAASNGFVDRLMQAHVASFQHWLKSPDTPFVHSQCHECLEHPAV